MLLKKSLNSSTAKPGQNPRSSWRSWGDLVLTLLGLALLVAFGVFSSIAVHARPKLIRIKLPMRLRSV